MELLFVHGGVSGSRENLPDLSSAVTGSMAAATALDGVEIATIVLEDDDRLNAGKGSVVDRAGNLSLDAGIADGRTGRFGAVAGVTTANPVRLARRVLEETPHVFLIGEGAEAIASDLPKLNRPTDEQASRWERARDEGRLDLDSFGDPAHVDTVGAVALDDVGGLAAASSTGGVFGKLPGRVGDSPVFGAGIFASDRVAVVGTGVGELFIETLAAVRVALGVERGVHPQRACEAVIDFLGERSRWAAGLLALDSEGRWGAAYRGASWSVFGPAGRIEAVAVP